MIDEMGSQMATQMAAKLDIEIRRALDAFWAEPWSLEDVKRRCQIVGRFEDLLQILYVDGIPVLEIHPLQTETVKTETGWVLRASQNFRCLHSPTTGSNNG